MEHLNFLVREPLLDPRQQVVGYELSWRKPAPLPDDEVDLESMASLLGEQLADPEHGWQLGDKLVCIPASAALLASTAVQSLPPHHTVLILKMSDLARTGTLPLATSLREQQYGILVKETLLPAQVRALAQFASHIELPPALPSDGSAEPETPASSATPDLPDACRSIAADGVSVETLAGLADAAQQAGLVSVCRVVTWDAFDAAAARGSLLQIGALALHPRVNTQAGKLAPDQGMILQLMDMALKNADVRKLEEVLKRDAALSYKLLRYINSPGFGLGIEVQSLRHAVAMLGYAPLYRWLTVLLAATCGHESSPLLMQNALVRARFIELVGQGMLSKSEAENLFVTGMFSLLDRLLGVPMESLLDRIQLPDEVTQALLVREGAFGPFLLLAEACEAGNGDVAERAEALFVSPRQFNEAHLKALKWAQNLKL